MSNLAECRADFCSTFTDPTSRGVSTYSTLIEQIIEDAGEALFELQTTLTRDSAFKSLNEIFERNNFIGWDGYDALPISAGAYFETLRFLKKLPSIIPTPEIVPEPTGEIGLEWRNNQSRIIVLSFSGEKKIIFAGISGGESTHGTEPFIEQISPKIIRLIKKFV